MLKKLSILLPLLLVLLPQLSNGQIVITPGPSAGGGSGNAPSDATYITQTSSTGLSNEQALASLSTGLMFSTTTTGVITTIAPTDDNLVVGSGVTWALKALSSCSAGSSALTYNTTTNAFGCNTISASPGGSDTQVQFNDSGSFAGDSGLTWDKTTNIVSFVSGGGTSFAGVANPITITGGTDGVGDTAIIVDNTIDQYLVLKYNQDFDIFGAPDTEINISAGTYDIALANGAQIALDPTTPTLGGRVRILAGNGDDPGEAGAHIIVYGGGSGVDGNLEFLGLNAIFGLTGYLLVPVISMESSGMIIRGTPGYIEFRKDNLDALATIDSHGNINLAGDEAVYYGNSASLGSLLADTVDVVIDGARFTGSNGSLIITGLGDGTDEDLIIDLNSANVGTFTSSTGLDSLVFSSIGLTVSYITSRFIANGSTPSVSDTSANSCGSGTETIVGTDNAGKVTIIGSVGTSCTVTFATAFINEPSCSVTNETTANLSRATSTTTTVILAGTFLQNDIISYLCMGR